MNQPNKKLVSADQGLVAKLREIRNNDMGATVTFHFDEEITYLDFLGDPTNKPINRVTSGRKWIQVTNINHDIFYEKGKKRDLIEVAQNFAAIAWDLGAFKFEI